MSLPAVQFPALGGPARAVQYCIEIVGPKTMRADAVKAVLGSQWQSALGQPEAYVMAAADSTWRRLDSSDTSAAYDSLLLCWDMVSPKGTISEQSAQHLFGVAENLARQLERRAMPMPIPADVPRTVRALEQIRESFDIGVNLSVISSAGGFPEKEIWDCCQGLGLQFGPTGLFEWRIPGWDYALLGVGPLGDKDSFTLGQVQAGVTHPAVDVGFSVPLSPNPGLVLDTAFAIADRLAQDLNGVALDEEDKRLDDRARNNARKNLGSAFQAMNKAGIAPGSNDAVKLFG